MKIKGLVVLLGLVGCSYFENEPEEKTFDAAELLAFSKQSKDEKVKYLNENGWRDTTASLTGGINQTEDFISNFLYTKSMETEKCFLIIHEDEKNRKMTNLMTQSQKIYDGYKLEFEKMGLKFDFKNGKYGFWELEVRTATFKDEGLTAVLLQKSATKKEIWYTISVYRNFGDKWEMKFPTEDEQRFEPVEEESEEYVEEVYEIDPADTMNIEELD